MPDTYKAIIDNLNWNNLKDNSLLIVEETNGLMPGYIINDYTEKGGKVYIKEKLISKGNYVKLNEKLDYDDERKIIEIIKKQLKQLFWSLYTKSGMIM